jgi:PAS domain S-box-containing protein
MMSDSTSNVADKINQLQALGERLDTLEWEQLRQKTALALAGWLTYSMEALIVVSPRGRILDLNNRAKNLLGYPEDDQLIKRPFESLFVPPQSWTEIHVNLLKYPKMSLRTGLRGVRADGTPLQFTLYTHPMNIENHIVSGVVLDAR